MSETIGFIGLGNMGQPMARRLIAAGYPLVLHDLDPDRAAAVARQGGAVAATPAEAAARATAVITMVPDSAAVEAAVLGPNGVLEGARPGLVVIDMSSSSPLSTRRLGQRLAERGVHMLDAPVSGGVRGAIPGTLTIMVGGDPALFERFRPVFERMGKTILHVGGLGDGHAIKAINNLLSATTLWSACEALLVAVKLGIDPRRMLEVVNASTGKSGSTEVKLPRFVLPRKFDAGFQIGLMYKDVSTALEMGKAAGVPMLLGALVQQAWGAAVARGMGAEDHTAIIRVVEELAGFEAPRYEDE